ncbi:MAG: glycosyltransferase family 2 protein [Paraglaciecola sp.]|uniref:glycosyltransferase family 2 protein n=1 Tax=Paraglaciecola sp. TaxID=1920173 RepID=UPI0032974CDB
MVTLSIIMPVYNVSAYLGTAIDSIQNQTFSDFEFLIMDDGSTDETLHIANQYAKQDPRIKVFPRENRKVAACLNELVTLANGQYIARMDGDDIAYPTRLEKQLNYLRNNQDVAVVGSWVQTFGERNETWHFRHSDNYSRNLLFFGVTILCHPTWMLAKSLLLKYPYLDAFRFIIDREWLSRVAIAEPELQFVAIPEVLLEYRMHQSSVSGVHQQQQRLRTNNVIDLYLKTFHIHLSADQLTLFSHIAFAEVVEPTKLPQAGQIIELVQKGASVFLADDHKVFREKWLRFCLANDALHLADKYLSDDEFVFFIEHKYGSNS